MGDHVGQLVLVRKAPRYDEAAFDECHSVRVDPREELDVL